jgi:rSAM/selenodomain-associated transferase 1
LIKNLILFARQPKLGEAKRRLAKDIGYVAAHNFYRSNLTTMAWKLGNDPRWRTSLFASPDQSASNRKVWPVPSKISIMKLGEGDIGHRMYRAFKSFPHEPCVIIGCDIPEVNRNDILIAFRSLQKNKLVFGPASDGGFWLIGVKNPTIISEKIFSEVRWSTPNALNDTLSNLPKNFPINFVRELSDIDHGSSWHRWKIRKHSHKIGLECFP